MISSTKTKQNQNHNKSIAPLVDADIAALLLLLWRILLLLLWHILLCFLRVFTCMCVSLSFQLCTSLHLFSPSSFFFFFPPPLSLSFSLSVSVFLSLDKLERLYLSKPMIQFQLGPKITIWWSSQWDSCGLMTVMTALPKSQFTRWKYRDV